MLSLIFRKCHKNVQLRGIIPRQYSAQCTLKLNSQNIFCAFNVTWVIQLILLQHSFTKQNDL